MKKFFSILLVSAMLILSSAFTSVTPKTYAIKLGYTCESMEVAIDSVYGSFNGVMFNYRINYCSQAFSAQERYVKFTMMFVDKAGNVLAETSTGPVINNNKLSGKHIANVPLSQEPYDCIISWFYKDINGGYKTVTEPDGTVVQERSTAEDKWHLISTHSLKLFKFQKN